MQKTKVLGAVACAILVAIVCLIIAQAHACSEKRDAIEAYATPLESVAVEEDALAKYSPEDLLRGTMEEDYTVYVRYSKPITATDKAKGEETEEVTIPDRSLTLTEELPKEEEEEIQAAPVQEQAATPEIQEEAQPQEEVTYTWSGSVLTAQSGVNYGPSGRETYYNLNMSGVVQIMRGMGNTDEYWVRSDGCKMLGDYIMCAANLSVHPRGSLVESSLGTCIVCDTGGFAYNNPYQLDIATTW